LINDGSVPGQTERFQTGEDAISGPGLGPVRIDVIDSDQPFAFLRPSVEKARQGSE
jgi:hypothetical protein